MPSMTMLYKYFLEIDEALEEAGLLKLENGFSDEYLLTRLNDFIKENNRIPNKKDCAGINRSIKLPNIDVIQGLEE